MQVGVGFAERNYGSGNRVHGRMAFWDLPMVSGGRVHDIRKYLRWTETPPMSSEAFCAVLRQSQKVADRSWKELPRRLRLGKVWRVYPSSVAKVEEKVGNGCLIGVHQETLRQECHA